MEYFNKLYILFVHRPLSDPATAEVKKNRRLNAFLFHFTRKKDASQNSHVNDSFTLVKVVYYNKIRWKKSKLEEGQRYILSQNSVT